MQRRGSCVLRRRFTCAVVAALLATPFAAGAEKILEGEAARDWAVKNGLTVHTVTADGRVIGLRRIVNNRPIYYTQFNDGAATTAAVDHVWPGGVLPYALTGVNVKLAIWDGGTVRITHQDLTGRASYGDSSFSSYSGNDHATHVSGTIIGDGDDGGAGDDRARGMAYAATLLCHDWDNDNRNGVSVGGEADSAASAGVRASNHSYGAIAGWYGSTWYGDTSVSNAEDYLFGFYDSDCYAWDAVMYNHPRYLAVFAAGNDRNDVGTGSHPADGNSGTGYDSVVTPAVCKNGVTVGAIYEMPAGYSSTASVVMSDFSNWGPCDDGRIKPDVVTKGVNTYSLAYYDGLSQASNQAYTSKTGTSMAAPVVTGSLGLLIEHYRNTHNVAAPYDDDPLAATLKALVIHSADEAGSAPGPDYRYGWGALNVASAAQIISDDVALPNTIIEEKLVSSETHEYYVYSNGTEDLKATLVWTDPPGVVPPVSLDPTTPALVNDLDLRIVRESNSTTYYPWRLIRDTPTAAPQRGDNTVDTVEQVLVTSPMAGGFRIVVSHKSVLNGGAQDYALVVTGAAYITDSVAPRVSTGAVDVVEGATESFAVQLPGAPGGPITVSAAIVDGAGVNIIAGQTLSFDNDNWETPQTVTVEAASDVDACDESAVVRLSRSDVDAHTDVAVAVRDLDQDLAIDLGLTPDETAFVIDEGKSRAVYVALTAAPCGNVEVYVTKTGGDGNINVSAGSTLVFMSNNWSTPQAVTFTSSPDNSNLADGEATFVIEADSGALTAYEITVYDRDDDELALVMPVNVVYVTEGSQAWTVVGLNVMPEVDLQEAYIARADGDADIQLLTPADGVIRFHSGNWISGVALAFTAAEDEDSADGVASFRITFADRPDAEQILTVKEVDNDPLLIQAPTQVSVKEGEAVTAPVRLNRCPPSKVSVRVLQLSGWPGIGIDQPLTLVFDETNWDVEQEILVYSDGDADALTNSARLYLSADGLPSAVITVMEEEQVAQSRPATPKSPLPTHLATNVETTVTLSWTNAVAAEEYDVYLSTNAIPRADDYLATTTEPTLIVEGLDYLEGYHWRVFARNSRGMSASAIWTFYTGPEPAPEPEPQATEPEETDGDGAAEPLDGVDDATDVGDINDVTAAPCGGPLLLTVTLGLVLTRPRRPRRNTPAA